MAWLRLMRWQNLIIIALTQLLAWWCVVLPQGEFADFLRAKPAERRTILLKLLGAGLIAAGAHLLLALAQALRKRGKEVVICGDFNIAHKEIDLKNYKSNKKNSGFLPHERAWLDTLFGEVGYVDAHRTLLAPDQAEYTWWSNRGRAWDNNVGWRIDYQVISPDLAGRLHAASVYRDQRFSDHAPVTVEFG